MTHIGKIVAVAITLSLAAHTAHAATEPAQVSVSYADLDLSRRAGAETLLARLQAGAGRVCGTEQGKRTLPERKLQSACLKQAMDGAVARIGAPLVTALYGQPQPLSQIALGE
jgi:UrcA family protein